MTNDRIDYASAGAVRQHDHIYDLAHKLGRAIMTIEILLHDLEALDSLHDFGFINGDIRRAKELVKELRNR